MAAVLLAVFFVPELTGGPERHLDGRGPLASMNDPRSSTAQAFDPNIGGPTWTVGIPLCLGKGDQPAVLDGSVSATKTIGTDFRYLGAYVRQFTPSQSGSPIYSMQGFPPSIPDVLQPVKGFTVRYHCQPAGKVDRSVPYAELLLGFGRGSGTGGGGWTGVDVGYTSGGHHHVVSIGWATFICGPSVPSQYCPVPSASPTPTSVN